jgi:hypothetical protein
MESSNVQGLISTVFISFDITSLGFAELPQVAFIFLLENVLHMLFSSYLDLIK